jgi:hypothetical protein
MPQTPNETDAAARTETFYNFGFFTPTTLLYILALIYQKQKTRSILDCLNLPNFKQTAQEVPKIKNIISMF